MPGTPRFHLQLSFWNNAVNERNAKEIADAGDMDPLSQVINQFNPITVLASAVHNVEVGSRVHGHDRGNLIEAQGVGWVDQLLPIVGKAIDKTFGKILWADSPAMESIGHVLSAGIQVKAQTGVYGF